MAAHPILRAEGLAKRFGGVIAADGVTIDVPSGELRCIIGPNGAGKSTLFSLLCGIIHPDSGRVYLKSEDVTRLPAFRRVRRGLGLTFQTNRVFHRLSVRQNLDAAIDAVRADRRRDADERYHFALQQFGLEPMSEVQAKELPHHQQQWLELAMVLAAGPEVVLLDEPTAGMSPEETLKTAAVLKHLNARGLTIVVVEHDISFVREVAQRVTVLHQGCIFAEGSVSEITDHADVRRTGYTSGDVLQGISIEVSPGEIVGVLGRNGVGKTALMRTLIGLVPARSGSILFRGDDITRLPANRRAVLGIGYVPQGRDVFPQMSVVENIRMGQFVNRSRPYSPDEVYGYFPFLKERARQRAGTLSGGQQEMLAIARALVARPDLLLLDEPSDGVQPSIVQEIGAFIVRLVESRPIGVLIVEQNIDLMQRVVHRAYVMDKGRVVVSMGRDQLQDTERLAGYLAV
jgi:branched-chain amino acid transport system ATP-binding protein